MSAASLARQSRLHTERIVFVDLVVLPGGPHPIPFRTRSLSPSGPMVLRLKARESRSPPGLPSRYAPSHNPSQHNLPFPGIAAGWSSPVARQAHNLKVTGSNPVPATRNPSKHKALANRLEPFSYLGTACPDRPALDPGAALQLKVMQVAEWADEQALANSCRREIEGRAWPGLSLHREFRLTF